MELSWELSNVICELKILVLALTFKRIFGITHVSHSISLYYQRLWSVFLTSQKFINTALIVGIL